MRLVKNTFPDSYINFFIDKSCSQISQFLLNHECIDKISISKEKDRADFELNNLKDYSYIFHPYPNITKNDYYNYHSVQKENFIMSLEYSWEENSWRRISEDLYDYLNADEKKPKLNLWFDVERHNNTIAIFPEAGYNNNDPSIVKRSPNTEWWNKMEALLSKKGFNIVKLGFKDKPNMSLFDVIKFALGCDLVLSTESGAAHIIGAYGHPQIVFYTNYKDDHHSNLDAFVPFNYKNNLLSFCGADKNINNISQEEIISTIECNSFL